MTLLELIVACAILMVLATAALPTARHSIRRGQERELRLVLREMRDAIDRYKDAADRNLFQVEVGTEGYPPDLETLVRGVSIGAEGRRLRFLRRIPVDPLTGRAEWGMRSVQDDANARSWGGQNVFDVFSLSNGRALDGTNYADW